MTKQIQQVLDDVEAKLVALADDFSGQLTVEIHCKDGVIKDVYMTERAKVKP